MRVDEACMSQKGGSGLPASGSPHVTALPLSLGSLSFMGAVKSVWL